MTCIYCLRVSEETEFDREHVIPAAFGRFERNLTLLNLVCRQCNQQLGNTLDRILARGSPEGLHRLNYGVQPAEKASLLDRRRVRFAWDSEKEEWKGTKLELIAEGGQLVVQLVPQVGSGRVPPTERP